MDVHALELLEDYVEGSMSEQRAWSCFNKMMCKKISNIDMATRVLGILERGKTAVRISSALSRTRKTSWKLGKLEGGDLSTVTTSIHRCIWTCTGAHRLITRYKDIGLMASCQY
jgi:hypothetical protein